MEKNETLENVNNSKAPPAEETQRGKISTLEETEFWEFFTDLESQQIVYEIKCYRVVKNRAKWTRKYLRTYDNECPRHEDIAMEFGSGHFWLTSRHPKTKAVVYKDIFIDEIWDEKRAQAMGIRTLPAGGPPAQLPNVGDPMDYFRSVMQDIVVPILKVTKDGAAQGGDVSTQMGRMMDVMSEGMVKNILKIQSAVVTKNLEAIQGPPAPAPEDEGVNNSIIKDVLDYAKMFGDKFLASRGSMGDKFESLIKKNSAFQQAEKNPDLLSAVYQAACDDGEIGHDKAKALFERLGFEVKE